jgi:hypothetical protein
MMALKRIAICPVSLILLFAFPLFCLAAPCTDSLYLVLSTVPLDSMTSNQALYYAQMKTQCEQQQVQEAERDKQAEQDYADSLKLEANIKDAKGKAGTAVACILVVLLIVGVVLGFVISNAKKNAQKRIDDIVLGT